MPTDITMQSHDDAGVFYHHDASRKYVTYILVFARDEGIHGVGGHDVDVEFVRSYYDDDGKPLKFFLSCHSRMEGRWVEASKMTYTDDHRPIVYAALGTHAHYESVGVWVRGFGFANDVARDDVRFESRIRLIPIDDPLTFLSRFTPDHWQWNATTDKLPGAPRGRLACLLNRFFLPLSTWMRKRI